MTKLRAGNIETFSIKENVFSDEVVFDRFKGKILTFDTIYDLPLSSVLEGSLAYIANTSSLYIWINQGWYKIGATNVTPTDITGVDAIYKIQPGSSPFDITLSSTDPEGFPLFWSVRTSISNPATTITQNNNVFTVTPAADATIQETYTATFSATDGINVVYTSSSIVTSSGFNTPYGMDISQYNIGDPLGDGFYAGIIDTTVGNINSADYYQSGERYVLIVSPKIYESAALAWDSVNRVIPNNARTRWNGLGSTDYILSLNTTGYEIFDHIRTLRTTNPVPDDGGSDWYVPALDELELLYRNFKPTTQINNNANQNGSDFPQTIAPRFSGFNPSSDPTGGLYSSNSDTNPSQTTLIDFQSGGSQSIEAARYWTSTKESSNRVWRQNFTLQDFGSQASIQSEWTPTAAYPVRPVRKIPIA